MKTIIFRCGLAISLVFVHAQTSLGRSLARITVSAAGHTRVDAPVSVELPTDMLSHNLTLWETTSGAVRCVPSQIEPGDPARLWWILEGTTAVESVRTYELKAQEGSGLISANLNAAVVKDESVLRLVIGNHRVLDYHHAPVPAPEGKSENYARSAFIHPLFSPSGHVLTEMQPPDHLHHMGIWMPWTKTEFEGRKIDFWNLGKNQGTVRFKEFISKTGGQIYGGFVASQQHIDLTAPEGEKTALNETWDVRVYNVGGPEKGYWLWDFKSTQRCATQSPLHHLKYHYSGQGFRATREWKGSNCNYLTSEGKTRDNANATRARWCDCYGSFGPYWAGVTIMSHPQNFRHPEPMRIWSGENDHLYFGFTPSQLGDWTMEPGKDYVFRYRFFVHDGKASVAEIERIWNDYANPPTIKIELVQ